MTRRILFTLCAFAIATPVLAEQRVQGETLARDLERIELELEAESLLVKLHQAPLAAERDPCIDDAASPCATSATAELEAVVKRLAEGDLTDHLHESAYFAAVNAGRIRITEDGRIAVTE